MARAFKGLSGFLGILMLGAALLLVPTMSSAQNADDVQKIAALEEMLKMLRAQGGNQRTIEMLEAELAKLRGNKAEPVKEEGEEKVDERPLVEPSQEEQGDALLMMLFNHVKTKAKDPAKEVEESISKLADQLDADAIEDREDAEAAIILIGKDALRPMWRLRQLGNAERKLRSRRVLAALMEDKPLMTLLGMATRTSSASVKAKLNGSAADFALMLEQLDFKRIEKHKEIWALLLVSSKTREQTALILERYREADIGNALSLYFTIVEKYPMAGGETLGAFVDEIASNAGEAELLEMADYNVKHSGATSRQVLAKLAQAIKQSSLLKRFNEAKTSARRQVCLKLVRLGAEDPSRQAWSELFPTLAVEDRETYFEMVRREDLREALPRIAEHAPNALEVPELLTQLGDAKAWASALADTRSISGAAALVHWLPYSRMSLAEQIRELLTIIDGEDASLRYEASEMLRGYGSKYLAKKLVERFDAKKVDPMLAALLASHRSFLSEAFIEEHHKTLYESLDDLSKVEWLSLEEKGTRHHKLWKLVKSPIDLVKRSAINALLSMRDDNASRFAYALHFSRAYSVINAKSVPNNFYAQVNRSSPLLFEAFKAISRSGEYTRDPEHTREEQARREEKRQDAIDAAFGSLTEDASEDLKLKSLAYALALEGYQPFVEHLAANLSLLPEGRMIRAIVDDQGGAAMREKLVKETPLEVLRSAGIFIVTQHEGIVVDAVLRALKMRALKSEIDGDTNDSTRNAIAHALMLSSQRERLPDVLLELSRRQHSDMTIAILKKLQILGASSDFGPILDACARRMRFQNVREEILRAAVVLRDVDKKTVKRLSRGVGERTSVAVANLDLLEMLSDASKSVEELTKQGFSELPSSAHNTLIRALALRGNRTALNAVLSQKAKPTSIGHASFAYLFDGMEEDRGYGYELDVWSRSRYCWRFDTERGVYIRKEPEA